MRKAALILKILLASALLTMIESPVFAQEAAEQMTGQAMLNEAELAVQRIDSIVSDAQAALVSVRNEGDVAKIDSINSLVMNVRGYLSVAQNAELNLRDAVSREDVEAQQHHFKIIQLALAKANEISAKISETVTGSVSVSGTTVQSTTRACSVEPCLGGEEYYEPSKADALGNPVEAGSELDADASSYL